MAMTTVIITHIHKYYLIRPKILRENAHQPSKYQPIFLIIQVGVLALMRPSLSPFRIAHKMANITLKY
jgi:hypothetical protein